jgi:hypothetical protein
MVRFDASDGCMSPHPKVAEAASPFRLPRLHPGIGSRLTPDVSAFRADSDTTEVGGCWPGPSDSPKLSGMTTPSASGANRLPRDAAGHLDLNEGMGGLIAMCSCDGSLEVLQAGPDVPDSDALNDRSGPHQPSHAVRGRYRRQRRVIKSDRCPRAFQGMEILNGAVFGRPIDKPSSKETGHE